MYLGLSSLMQMTESDWCFGVCSCLGYLADVVAMYHGPFSARFKYFDCSVGKSWLCFVIELEDRTFDIICDDEDQVSRGVPC